MVYTFGAPRTGDESFRAGYAPPHWRFENVADAVPLFCPPPFDVRMLLPQAIREMVFSADALPDPVTFRHVGQLALINATGLRTDQNPAAWRRVGMFLDACTDDEAARVAHAHMPASYVRALERSLGLPSHSGEPTVSR